MKFMKVLKSNFSPVQMGQRATNWTIMELLMTWEWTPLQLTV